MANIPNESLDNPSDVHLPWFWTLWRRNQTWRDDLAKRAAHKALDIPEDMGVNVTHQTATGIGWKELVALGLMGAAGAGGAYLLTAKDAPPAASQTDSKPVRGSIRFWVDEHGNTQIGEQEVNPE